MQEVRKFRVAVVLCFIVSVCEVASDTYYSSYYGTVLSSSDVTTYTSNGTLANCTNLVATCNSTEGRRLDGSCNNLNYPVRGATRTPQFTYLPTVFNQTSSTVYDPKLSESGEPLPSARLARDSIIADGQAEDSIFTVAVTHFLVLILTDMTNTKDTTNYVTWRPHCCDEAGKSDYMCAPNLIPEDDYVHRFSGIRCLNMTRPLTFQTSGCLANTTKPTRIIDATPSLDMSPIYGNAEDSTRRSYVNGTLATETVDGRPFPASNVSQLLFGVNYIPFTFWWRYHNVVANYLIEVNPCWSDNKTFSVAREITIACANQITYYELMPELAGTDNLIADGVICNSTGFRDPYNSSLTPAVATDAVMACRYFHKVQEGKLKYYDSDGTYLNKSFPLVNLTTNLTYIKQNGVMDYVSLSCIKQPCGKFDDNVADPLILNMGLGGLQKAMDIMTNDLSKNRYFGIQPYIYYRDLCFGDNITCFDDLDGIIYPELKGILQSLYTSVSDIDMLMGTWIEMPMEGGYIPPTLYCLLVKQLLHNMQSDRHWYEREDRPNAFSEDQLTEIRKMTAARFFCEVGDGITEVQPRAFVLPGTDNEIVSCDDIPQIDYSMWADSTCDST